MAALRRLLGVRRHHRLHLRALRALGPPREGITPATAALAFGLLSGLNAVAVLLVGPLSDKLPRKTLLGVVYLVRGVAFILLVVLPGPAALWGFAIVGGASWLATVPLTTSLAPPTSTACATSARWRG